MLLFVNFLLFLVLEVLKSFINFRCLNDGRIMPKKIYMITDLILKKSRCEFYNNLLKSNLVYFTSLYKDRHLLPILLRFPRKLCCNILIK